MNYFFAVNFFFAHIFLHTKAVCYSMLIKVLCPSDCPYWYGYIAVQ